MSHHKASPYHILSSQTETSFVLLSSIHLFFNTMHKLLSRAAFLSISLGVSVGKISFELNEVLMSCSSSNHESRSRHCLELNRCSHCYMGECTVSFHCLLALTIVMIHRNSQCILSTTRPILQKLSSSMLSVYCFLAVSKYCS